MAALTHGRLISHVHESVEVVRISGSRQASEEAKCEKVGE
jgi:hypothetical protein